MTKNSFKADRRLLSLILVVLGILTAFTLLLPALHVEDSDSVLKGYEVAFGFENFRYGSISGGVQFDIFVTLAYFLPLVGGLIAYYLRRGELLSFLIFVASVILLLLVPGFTKLTFTFGSSVMHNDVEWVMGVGLILPIIFSILGTLVSLYMVVKHFER